MGKSEASRVRAAGYERDGAAILAALTEAQAPARDVADAIHLLCALHGRHPGLLDHAHMLHRAPWLAAAVAAFTEERALLARLASAVGPTPSTPGQAETEAAIAAQRHALAMLGRSERAGCALGAAAAFIADWRAIRPVLDSAAHRYGIAAEPLALMPAPDDDADRAYRFGAEQLHAQHRALWDLIEVRAAARARS